MSSREIPGNGQGDRLERASRQPRLTRGWVEAATAAHRVAFEEEMARKRRSLDREFDRFWRSHRPD